MNKLFPVFTLICIYILTGCASKQAEYDSSLGPLKTDSIKATNNTINQTPAAINIPGITEPVKTAPVATTTAPTPLTQTKTAAGMNPAHGQPGHDCAIAVGAPLNSKTNAAAKTITPPPIKTDVTSGQSVVTPLLPAVTPVQPAATPLKNTAGIKLNPAHGQPGHDCAIAVGQPLKN